jgi:hypothetical protein
LLDRRSHGYPVDELCRTGVTAVQQQNILIATLVDMDKRDELRLPEIQQHYVWRATWVRDLFDSLYRG